MTNAHGNRPAVWHVDFDVSWELQTVISGNHNLLLEGPDGWTESMLGGLTPLLRMPVLWTTHRVLPPLPDLKSGSLVVRNIAALHRDDQRRLFKWTNDRRRQVISTSVHPLFAAVVQREFDEALYYRLNVMLVCASDHDSPAPAVLAGDRSCS